MKSLAAAATVAALALAGLASAAPAPGTTAVAAPAPATGGGTSSCPALLQYTFPRLQDEKPQPLCQYAGRVLLVVNTASYCGYTPQYQGLEDLYARYRDKGLVVLGFPSNDFGQQEPGNAKQIAEVCFNTFGVKFPMFDKTVTVGPKRHPLYTQLVEATGKAPGWNFHKYLIGRDGRVLANFPSAMEPMSRPVVSAVEAALK